MLNMVDITEAWFWQRRSKLHSFYSQYMSLESVHMVLVLMGENFNDGGRAGNAPM